MGIRWVDGLPPRTAPGAKPQNRPKHYTFAQQLRKNPGVWAILSDDEWNSYGGTINTGKNPSFLPTEDGRYEAASRRIATSKPNRARIYVRWIPTDEAE
jgi:hypothetical protein